MALKFLDLTFRSLILVVFLLLGCNSYKSKVRNSDESPLSPASIDYAFVNAKVFQPICLHCHSLAGGNKGGVNLETYENVLANLNEIENDVFVEGSMPPESAGGPLASYEKSVLKTWIDAGTPREAMAAPVPRPTPKSTPAPEPTPVPTPVVDPGFVGAKWSEISKNIFEPKCIQCHQAGEKAGDFPFKDKAWVTDPANGIVEAGNPAASLLYMAITRRDKEMMPPRKTGMTLSSQEIDAIRKWILNGAKD